MFGKSKFALALVLALSAPAFADTPGVTAMKSRSVAFSVQWAGVIDWPGRQRRSCLRSID